MMNRFSKPGEGTLLGIFLCVLMIVTAVTAFVSEPSAATVSPVHEMDIMVTPEPAININTASAEMLTELDGIGTAIAERIVEWRTENGPFETVDELTSVSGIGEAKLDAIRDRICVN